MVDFVLQQSSVCKPNLVLTITYLKLSALQLFFRSLQGGGNLVIWFPVSGRGGTDWMNRYEPLRMFLSTNSCFSGRWPRALSNLSTVSGSSVGFRTGFGFSVAVSAVHRWVQGRIT